MPYNEDELKQCNGDSPYLLMEFTSAPPSIKVRTESTLSSSTAICKEVRLVEGVPPPPKPRVTAANLYSPLLVWLTLIKLQQKYSGSFSGNTFERHGKSLKFSLIFPRFPLSFTTVKLLG